jgi:predicted phage tail protein
MEKIKKFQIVNAILAFSGISFIAIGFMVFSQQDSFVISLMITFIGCAMAISGIASMIELKLLSDKLRH